MWGEPKEHLTDCYFCLVNTKGIGKKNRLNISYPSIPSAILPVIHSDEFPPPAFNGFVSSEDDETESEEEHVEMEYKKTDTESEDSSSSSVSFGFSRLGAATADNFCIFVAWHLFYGWMLFLPPTYRKQKSSSPAV